VTRTLLLSVHSAERGGAEVMALSEAEYLKRWYRLVIAMPDGPLRAAFAEHGEVVPGSPRLPLYGASPARWASRLARSAADSVRLAALIRRRVIDLVLVNSMVSLSPLLAARLAGVPGVVNPRYDATQAAPEWWRSLFAQTCAVEGALADTVIAISNGVAEQFAGARRARIVRIPDGIEIPPLPLADALEAPAPGGQGAPAFGRPLRLCMVGGIDPIKSQHVAVDALAVLRERGVDAVLDLVGPVRDSAYEGRLRSRAAELGLERWVRLRGPSRDVDEALAGADVLLHTSGGEATPLILMEALARLKPVVATRVGDVETIVRHDDTGLLTEAGDAEAVAAAVERYAADPELARAMAERGREWVARKLDRRHSLEQLRRELDRCLGARADRAPADPVPARAA
jgi:glycosyltransferase involved in cell wall biosynthesis